MHFPIPKPVRGRIAQVYSTSDDPSAASLLALAPELRNQIYEYLLVDLQQIKIEKGDDDTVDKISDFAGDPAIILTCRQIYHEAVGVLYSQNIFRFEYCEDFYEAEGAIISPVKVCFGWIKDIGSCLLGLRTVIISLNMPDRSFWYGGDDFREDFALSPAMTISVEFESTDDDASISNVKFLNKALYELGKKDTLGLKRTRRLLRQVYVDPSGTRGTISYRSTGQGIQVRREFRLSKETQTYETVPRSNPLGLLHLPAEMICAIARLALINHEATYNFETGIMHGHEFGMLNVNKQLRNIVRPYFLSEGRFTIILGSDTLQPAKALYEGLERRIAETFEDSRLYSIPSTEYCTPIEAAQDYGNVPTIVLQFQTTDHVQISAWDLLRVTTVFPPDITIIIRVRGHSDNLHATTLGEIRKYALVFMEDLKLKATPDNRRNIVEVSLNEQCLSVRAIFRKGDQGLEHVGSNMVKAVDTMDITSLHDTVRAVTWRPYEQMDGFKYVTQPKSWDDKTMYGLVKRLWSLC